MSHEEQPLPIGRDLRLGDGRAGHPHDLDFGAGHHIVPFQGAEGREKYIKFGIRKERIEPGEPWMDYAETLFSIQRRLADFAFSNARIWPEIQQAHQTWWQNYNVDL